MKTSWLAWGITIAAVGALVYVLGQPQNQNDEGSSGGGCASVMTTCRDGSTQPTPCDCDGRGGIAPYECQGKTGDALRICLEKSIY